MLIQIQVFNTMLWELEKVNFKTVKVEDLKSVSINSKISTIELEKEEISRDLLKLDSKIVNYDNRFLFFETIKLNYLLNSTFESLKNYGYTSKSNASKSGYLYNADSNLKEYLHIFFGDDYDEDEKLEYVDYNFEADFLNYIESLEVTDFNSKIKKSVFNFQTKIFKDVFKKNVNFFLCGFIGFLKTKKLLKKKNWYKEILK